MLNVPGRQSGWFLTGGAATRRAPFLLHSMPGARMVCCAGRGLRVPEPVSPISVGASGFFLVSSGCPFSFPLAFPVRGVLFWVMPGGLWRISFSHPVLVGWGAPCRGFMAGHPLFLASSLLCGRNTLAETRYQPRMTSMLCGAFPCLENKREPAMTLSHSGFPSESSNTAAGLSARRTEAMRGNARGGTPVPQGASPDA